MDEILANIQRQLQTCQILSASSQQEVDPVESLQGFVSVIKINGKPIPPPVMSLQKRCEMRQLRCAAVERERELASRRHMKLLEKVQNIVNGIEEWRSSSQASFNDDVTMMIEQQVDTCLAASNHEVAAISFTGHPDENMNNLKPVEPCTGDSSYWHEDANSGVVKSVQGSTSSSSDASLLNRTVISASGFSPKKLGIESKQQESLSEDQRAMGYSNLDVCPSALIQNSASNISGTSQATHDMDSLRSVGAVESLQGTETVTGGIKLACSWSKKVKNVPEASETDNIEKCPVSGLHLMPSIGFVQDSADDLEPFGEKESYLSLLGEYSSLPVPSRSSHFFSDVTEVPSSTPVDSASLKETERSPENNIIRKSDKSPNVPLPSKEDESSMFISSCSTLLTNTAGQSCTLPSSLRTVSAASTLQDIEDPWNTLIETPVPREEGLVVEGDISVPRGTPVGQEDGVGVNPTSATNFVKASYSVSGDNEFSSPEKRVRRNSYTLDHPSPALLNAQARNEAPHANLDGTEREMSARRSLELTNDDAEKRKSENKVDTFEHQKLEHQEEPSDEEFLHLQLQYLEEMRCQLEQQQRQQLQQLLIEQQEAQMALQQEMTQLEKRFRQKHGQRERTGEAVEGARKASREDMPGIVGAGSEVCENDPAILTSPTSVSSKKPSTASCLGSAGFIPSTETTLKQPSPSIITSASPTDKSTGTTRDGVKADPFYLGGTTRSPGEGENVTTSPMINRSPYKQLNSPTLKKKFDRVSAAVKGYLTRRVLQSGKVQTIIKTIKDSASFADKFIAETPIKKGNMSMQDMVLAERVLAQVRAAQYDLHDVFFSLSVAQRMELIQQSRKLKNEENHWKKMSPVEGRVPWRPLSAATMKALERKKKAREAEAKLFGQKRSPPNRAPTSRSRPVSAAEGRVLKPLMSQKSPIRPASANPYRPSKHGTVIPQNAPTTKEPKKLHYDSSRSKVNKVPGSTKQSVGSKARSPVMGKTKGVRRSLYPIANLSRKTARRTPEDLRK